MNLKHTNIYLWFALVVGGLCVLLAFGLGPSAAQEGATCDVMAQQAIASLGETCDALDRNSACYGYNSVEASFYAPQPEDFFTTPSDRTPLLNLSTITTRPFQSNIGEWGIAVMNVQANLPTTLPGQAVTFLLMGDAELENGVLPEAVTAPGDAFTVMTRAAVNLRSGPGTQFNVISSVPSAELLYADGQDPTQSWLRIVSGGRITWASQEFVESTEPGGLGHFPVLNAETRSSMQAFTFRSGFSGVECESVPPSSLVIQGPENMTVNLTANGTQILLGSTIVMFMTEDGLLQLITLDGTARINGVNVTTGYTIFAQVDESGQVIGNWFGARPATSSELAQFNLLHDVPDNILRYGIVVPSPPPPPQSSTSANGGSVGTGPLCAGFAPTSPLHPVNGGSQPFYWDPAPGADGGYRLVVMGEDNSVLNTFTTPAGTTTQTVNLSEYRGGNVQWEVQALNAAGDTICNTSRVSNFFSPAPIVTRQLTYAERCVAAGGTVMFIPAESCYVFGTGFINP